MTLPRPVAALLTARRVEPVPADRASALVRLTRAGEKLEAARQIAAIDVEVATSSAISERRALTPDSGRIVTDQKVLVCCTDGRSASLQQRSAAPVGAGRRRSVNRRCRLQQGSHRQCASVGNARLTRHGAKALRALVTTGRGRCPDLGALGPDVHVVERVTRRKCQ